jgi:hypothetical protein
VQALSVTKKATAKNDDNSFKRVATFKSFLNGSPLLISKIVTHRQQSLKCGAFHISSLLVQ